VSKHAKRGRELMPWWLLAGGALALAVPVYTLASPALHGGNSPALLHGAQPVSGVQAGTPAVPCQAWLPAEHCTGLMSVRVRP
jgi:hypothetical protein